jgi:hypothetical protein
VYNIFKLVEAFTSMLPPVFQQIAELVAVAEIRIALTILRGVVAQSARLGAWN